MSAKRMSRPCSQAPGSSEHTERDEGLFDGSILIDTNAADVRGEPTPLLRIGPAGTPAQAVLTIECSERRARARINTTGMASAAVQMGLHYCVGLPPTVSGAALADWLESDGVQQLLCRVCDGYGSYVQEGRSGGDLDADARAAYEDLCQAAMLLAGDSDNDGDFARTSDDESGQGWSPDYGD